MPCYQIDGMRPVVHPQAYVHTDAVLIGDVVIGPGVYVAPTASLRGDFGPIVMEAGSNIQDGCVVHSFAEIEVRIGQDGHIGHGAVLHGCTIHDDAMVGMNAVVMDGAVVGRSAFVAAMAFVRAGQQVADRTLVAGIPAKFIRDLSDQEINWKRQGTRDYHELVTRSMKSLMPVEPLAELEANRPRYSGAVLKPLHKTRG